MCPAVRDVLGTCGLGREAAYMHCLTVLLQIDMVMLLQTCIACSVGWKCLAVSYWVKTRDQQHWEYLHPLCIQGWAAAKCSNGHILFE